MHEPVEFAQLELLIVAVDLVPSSGLLSLSFKNAPTATVLNMLCRELNNCQWDFDAVRGLRVTPKR